MDDVPTFRYHPQPLQSGSAVESDAACAVCGEARGVIYNGPIYGSQPDALCLVCVASGQAAAELGVRNQPAEFTDVGWGVPDEIATDVLDEIAHRTPGFRGWQQEHWMFHCGDAAAFLGPVGYAELVSAPDALDMVLHENDEFGWSAEESQQYVRHLHPQGDATAYLFRCLHCGRHLAYTDMS